MKSMFINSLFSIGMVLLMLFVGLIIISVFTGPIIALILMVCGIIDESSLMIIVIVWIAFCVGLYILKK